VLKLTVYFEFLPLICDFHKQFGGARHQAHCEVWAVMFLVFLRIC